MYAFAVALHRCCEALSHEPPLPKPEPGKEQPVLGQLVQGDKSFAEETWRSPWVYFNCFLSIAALDDARLWGQFLAYATRGWTGTLDLVPQAKTLGGSWFMSIWHWPRIATNCRWFRPSSCCGYAYWLFAQDGNVYDFTGR
jgi:hypothetical protein